ncbi:hypothetical protein CDD81_2151 [Ophiocordyceps australis]|uniref:mRNA splicing factor RNA helicase n=1 Tax=Ophiocordyceps australis TaxID=1399860 RepID=A0A2C5XS14_9HYPO|nr:hypothetical protein CDD81_2151 [Ophiocordyceps australis]
MDPNDTSIRFRASKRKALRARSSSPSDTPDPAPVVRATRSRHLRGVQISNSTLTPTPASPPDAITEHPKGIPDRFTHQTGLLSDLDDRHMNAYIESRLSATALPPVAQDARRLVAPAARDGESPTKLGKLFEVDVSRHVEQRARPEQAERAPRGQKRRGSDDMKLGRFVEQFLNENKLQVFDLSSQAIAPPPSAGDDRSADDRLADEYRRRHNDQVALRRQRRRPAQPPRPQPPPGEILRGPKLGGSRNQRAAIRDILLQQERDRAKGGPGAAPASGGSRWP